MLFNNTRVKVVTIEVIVCVPFALNVTTGLPRFPAAATGVGHDARH